MDLHEHLRDLVARQGPDVVETAESFRAALDDYLTEDEATTGELNLLVDAVRLGGVHRLLSLVDHGAAPAAAVQEAGDGFARDRGTDDLVRCRWAVAVVGYALGRVAAAVVRANEAGTPASPAPAAPPPAPPPAPSPEEPPRTFSETEPVGSAPAPPPPPPPVRHPDPVPTRRRGRAMLVVPLVAAVVAGAVLAGIWLGSRDDPEQATENPGGEATSEDEPTGGEDTGGGGDSGSGGAAIPDNSIVLPITDGNGDSRIYAVDADTGASEELTDGPDDRLPVISPDRSTLIYLEGTPSGATRPMVLDIGTDEAARPLFGDEGACDYARRPAFDPNGDRLAVPCTNQGGDYQNTTVVDLDGNELARVTITGEPLGTPTWTSESTLVYAVDSAPSTLWEIRLPGQEHDPLTDGSQGWDSHPDWSDATGLLLFSRHPDQRFFGDLLTLHPDRRSGPSTTGELWGHPAWAPDGERVVFTERDGDTERLGVARVVDDTFSDVHYVPDLPGEPGIPAWDSR